MWRSIAVLACLLALYASLRSARPPQAKTTQLERGVEPGDRIASVVARRPQLIVAPAGRSVPRIREALSSQRVAQAGARAVAAAAPERTEEVEQTTSEALGNASERMARRFGREAPDLEWTRAAQASIMSLIDSAELDRDAIVSVDCRATVCRVELRFSDPASMSRLSEVSEPYADVYALDFAPAANPEHLALFAVRPGQRVSDLLAEDTP
jgi:hypothetical protein